jgi:hypothetical protein
MLNNGNMYQTSNEEALAIIDRGDTDETIELAERGEVSPEIFKILFKLYPDIVMRSPGFEVTIENTDYLRDLFQESKSVISSMQTLDFKWFQWLFSHPDPEVRQAAASNPSLPSNLYSFCTLSSDQHIRMGLAKNIGIPMRVIDSLLLDENLKVRQFANENPNGSGKHESGLRIVVPTRQLYSNPGATTLLQEGSDTFLEPSPENPYNDDSTDYSGLLGVDTKTHPIVFVAILLVLLCASLAMILLGKGEKVASPSAITPSSSPSPVSSAITPSPTTSDDIYISDAMSIAANNTLRSKSAATNKDWQLVAERWGDAIILLKRIPPSSSLYRVAQDRIKTYDNLKALADKKAS